MKYAALIGDIVESRNYQDRLLVQKLLKSSLNLLNEWFLESINKQMVISSGDEMQGLFKETYASYMYYRLLKMLLFPVKIRAGISFDELDYKMDWDSNELDGPVYRNAKNAVMFCKENNFKVIINSNNPNDKYVNMLLNLTNHIGKSNTITINLIQLFSELLFPLNPNINISNIELLKKIIEYKINIYNLEVRNDKIYNKDINFDVLKKYLDEGLYFNDKNEEIIFQSYWKKGFSTKVANILGIARQIVDRNYNYMNFTNLRNSEATIISILQNYYMEE